MAQSVLIIEPSKGGLTISDLVLPLELGPHVAEVGVAAGSGLDVVYDVDMDVVEHHHATVHGRTAHLVHCNQINNLIKLGFRPREIK